MWIVGIIDLDSVLCCVDRQEVSYKHALSLQKYNYVTFLRGIRSISCVTSKLSLLFVGGYLSCERYLDLLLKIVDLVHRHGATECPVLNLSSRMASDRIWSDQIGTNWNELERIGTNRNESNRIESDRIESNQWDYTTRNPCRTKEAKPMGEIKIACGIHKTTPWAVETTPEKVPGILLRTVFTRPMAANNGPYQASKNI